MQSWNIPLQTVVYRSFHELRRVVPAYCVLSFLILVICGFAVKYFHSKVYTRKDIKSVPRLSYITYLRASTACRRDPSISFLEVMLGACCLYRKEGIYSIEKWPVAKYVVLYDLEAIKFVLGSRIILKKGVEYSCFEPVLKDGLFMSSGSKHHKRRKQLAPSFHSTVLSEFFPAFNKQANILVHRIDELMKKETSVDVLKCVSQCTLDTLLETSAGVSCSEVGAQTEEMVELMHRASEIGSRRVVLPWLRIDSIFFRTKEGKMLANYSEILRNFAVKVIDKRKQDIVGTQNINKSNGVNESIYDTSCETKQRLPMLDQLLHLHLKDNSVSFEEIVEELQDFIGAGIESTSIAVSWTLYLLGLHQDIQRKVQEELDKVLGDDINNIVTFENVKSLNYLLSTLKEAMRLYPPIVITTRYLEEDSIIHGYEIEKGTTLVIPIYALHRNPEVFPNPEKFIPDRFNNENCKNIPPYAYIPFSAGPRNCLGQTYAMYSSMVILSTVLRRFNVQALEHRDKILLKFNVVGLPEKNIYLKFTRRQF